VTGPRALLAGQVGHYAGATLPITTSPPLTLTWDNGTVGAGAAYSWTLPGTYTLTVTATNRCGEGSGSLPVRVWAEWPFRCYLPLIARE